MNEELLQTLARHISEREGHAVALPIEDNRGNAGYIGRLRGRHKTLSISYMMKSAPVTSGGMIESEGRNLEHLALAAAIRVPEVVWSGDLNDRTILVMEWMDLQKDGDWALLGQQLAELHRYYSPQYYGWYRHNHIGPTFQSNTWAERWCDFFAEQRVGWQLNLAARNGFHLDQDGQLVQHIRRLLVDHNPKASLLHGDLWAGNAGFCGGDPVIYDPACYYGDREADLAMASLFGGFPEDFFKAYQQTWPLPDGWPLRRTIYNLYHLLNHVNLFGTGYMAQAESAIRQILKAC